ncbi:MAG: type II toxin-antitoxin system VapC family toxin [Candidatus Binatia bacterium]
MEALIYLDTHVVVWLYAGKTDLLTPRARASIEGNALLVSPLVVLELEFLREVGRLRVGADAIVEDLQARLELEVCDLSFAKVISAARAISWTRDPFDRVIVGHAIAGGRPLLTKDRSIRRRYRGAVW